jgi:hypothetical protein
MHRRLMGSRARPHVKERVITAPTRNRIPVFQSNLVIILLIIFTPRTKVVVVVVVVVAVFFFLGGGSIPCIKINLSFIYKPTNARFIYKVVLLYMFRPFL